jgi:CRISPR system Cascade subunit CasD
MGVRVDREGVMKREYQTAGGVHRKGEEYGVITADGKSRRTVTSNRYYLADADFLVGLEARDDAGTALLHEINANVRNPHWQIFLGRKACVPSVPIHLPEKEAIMENLSLLEALMAYPWPRLGVPTPPEHQGPHRLRFVIETDYGFGPETHYDQPEGAAFFQRRFLPRSVETIFKRLGDEIPVRKEVQHVSFPDNP